MKRRWRDAVRRLHACLGWGLGGLLLLLALTGSLLTFYTELDLCAHPQRAASGTVAAADLPWDEVARRLQARYPEYGEAWRIEAPVSACHPIMARYYHPPERQGEAFGPRIVTFDPVSLAVTSDRLWGHWGEFVWSGIYDLHYSLLAGNTGRIVLGWLGLLAIAFFLSGLVLWWPARGRWGLALRWQVRPHPVLRHYDWHSKLGFYGLLPLILIFVTGSILALPHVFRPLVQSYSVLWSAPTFFSQPVPGQSMRLPSEAVAMALSRYPQATVRWLELPNGSEGVYKITLRQPAEPSKRFPKTSVWVDPWQGEILAERDGLRLSAGDVFFAWMHPLHNGEALGLSGRLGVALSGILLLGLLLTGLWRWQDRRRAIAKKAR